MLHAEYKTQPELLRNSDVLSLCERDLATETIYAIMHIYMLYICIYDTILFYSIFSSFFDPFA